MCSSDLVRIVRYLSQNHGDLLGQFHKIAQTESLEG